MAVTWLPNTTQGYMFGDYISTSFSGGTAHPFLAVARPPADGLLDVSIHSGSLAVPSTGTVPVSADRVVFAGPSERTATAPFTAR
jgi:hypothetical protein